MLFSDKEMWVMLLQLSSLTKAVWSFYLKLLLRQSGPQSGHIYEQFLKTRQIVLPLCFNIVVTMSCFRWLEVLFCEEEIQMMSKVIFLPITTENLVFACVAHSTQSSFLSHVQICTDSAS